MKCIVKQITRLPFATGKLNIFDPIDGAEPEFDVPVTDHANIFAISSPLDPSSIAAVEIAFTQSDHNFSRCKSIGRVGVDSASIAVADRCLTDALEKILELWDVPPWTISLLAEKLQLNIRHLYDSCYEVLDRDLEGAHGRLQDFLRADLELNPDEVLHFWEDYKYLVLDRIDRCAGQYVNVPLGDFEFFAFSTGSDGVFDILGDERDGKIERCWIVLDKNTAASSNLEFEEIVQTD